SSSAPRVPEAAPGGLPSGECPEDCPERPPAPRPRAAAWRCASPRPAAALWRACDLVAAEGAAEDEAERGRTEERRSPVGPDPFHQISHHGLHVVGAQVL